MENTPEELEEAEIVIVDDGEVYVEAIREILTRRGFRRITTATNPFSALELILKKMPDLLLLDLHMPGMNGIELLMELQKQRTTEELCPVLILTGDTDPGLRDTALALGTMDYLNKPFRHAEVVLRVKNLLRMQLLHKEVRGYARTLEEKVDVRTCELSNAYLDTIYRLAKAAEYRDDDTGRHIQRVGTMAAGIAKRMGLDADFCDALLHAAQLHDIGKIGIPDNVLLKPGKLIPSEFDLIKTHTTIGARILSGSASPVLFMAGEIAISHHERWDGGGYPNALVGGDIPLAGRITSVADVFDALTHERPYKQAWSRGDALNEIARLRGLSFDPAVVDSFLELTADET